MCCFWFSLWTWKIQLKPCVLADTMILWNKNLFSFVCETTTHWFLVVHGPEMEQKMCGVNLFDYFVGRNIFFLNRCSLKWLSFSMVSLWNGFSVDDAWEKYELETGVIILTLPICRKVWHLYVLVHDKFYRSLQIGNSVN